jgi:RsiW-degrading membrane proteinase PrsW (M82 family)
MDISLTLILISLAPVVIIMVYMYYRDKYEKEPIKLLLKAFFGGLLAVFGTLVLSIPGRQLFDGVTDPLLKAFGDAFFVAAIPEEIAKFVFLYAIIWKQKDFNEKYDGIIYSMFLSLGFAAIENLMYVFDGGFSVGVMRAFTAVPGHALFGVTMGFYFALAKFEPRRQGYYLGKSLVSAILAHGIYDFILMYASHLASAYTVLLVLGFLLFLLALWQDGFKKIKQHIEASPFKND